MKIKGLPVCLWKSNAEVFFRGKPCPLLQKCHACEFYHPNYFVCPSGHVTCAECQGVVRANVDQVYCKACGSQAFRISIATNLMLNIDYACGCGYLGTLTDIKLHRDSNEFTEKCKRERPADDPIMLNKKFDIEEINLVLNSLRLGAQNKLDMNREIAENFGVELVNKRRFNESRLKILLLSLQGEAVLDFYEELKGEYDQIRALADTLMSPSIIREFQIRPILRGEMVERILVSPVMYAAMKLVLNKNGFADLFVKADFRRGLRCPRNFIGKLVSFRHHDLSGYILKETAFVIQSDGSIGREEDPDYYEKYPDLVSFRLCKNFIESPRFYGPTVLLSDSLKISVEIHPS